MRRSVLVLAFGPALGAASGLPAIARADLADVRVSEVSPGAAGEPNTAYVELVVPASGACFFPTTRLEVFDADGLGLGASPIVETATCVGGPAWMLFTPPDGATRWGVGRDGGLTLPLPTAAGQLCLVSSATRYDCVRWGVIVTPILDFDSPADSTSASSLSAASGLARTGDTGVVAADFELATPTPRAPNDGTVFVPPDAAILPDAAPTPDASTLDASAPRDARALPDASRPDAARTPGWLVADPGGGGCVAIPGRRPAPATTAVGGVLALAACGFRRRRSPR